MNLKNQEKICIAFLILGISIVCGQDFQFDNENAEDFQTILSEPLDVVSKAQPIKSIYSQEKAKCPHSENKIMLSLVLRTHSWDEIVEKKRQKAINKLSKFFMVPKENFIIDDITRADIHEMINHAIQRGRNNLKTNKKLGRLQFLIGCGKTYFPSEKLIAKQIPQQMKDNSIDDITGLNFGWWSIWKKHVNNRVPRVKRQNNDANEDEDYDDDYYDDEDDEGSQTEVPETHAHRHHHGDSNTEEKEQEETSTNIAQFITTTTEEPIPTTILATTEQEIVASTTSISTTTTTTTPETEVTTPKLVETTTLEPKSTTTESILGFTAELTTPPVVEEQKLSTIVASKQDEDNYDDEYDDDNEDNVGEITTITPVTQKEVTTTEKIVIPVETTTDEPTTTPTTTTTTTTTTASTTTEKITTTEYITEEPPNTPPLIKNRIAKQPITAGKVFTLIVPPETFYDNEDGTKLSLEMFDKNEQKLKSSSWMQFNAENREIYGLPLEEHVSRWQYKLRATDSAGESVTETLDITVQQHKAHRSVNHEISIALRLNLKFVNNVDWQIKVINAIGAVLGDESRANIVVRDIRYSSQDQSSATFVYTNETMPKDKCPEEMLDDLVKRLDADLLSEALGSEVTVKSVTGQQIGQCLKAIAPKAKPTPHITKNFPPMTRNQVDRVNATVGHLLIFKVPIDTFYDPEDGNELKLSLLTTERVKLDAHHWLQFDSKNQEFYGVPKSGDIGQREYLLVAEDQGGLTATDALIVVVNHWHKKDYSVLFEMTLDVTYETFNTSISQRRFVERVAQVFGDTNYSHIQIRNIRPIHHSGYIQVSYYNTTLYRQHTRCPDEEIEILRSILLHQDGHVRDKVRDTLGHEFSLQSVSLIPIGTCQGMDSPIHEVPTHKSPDETLPPVVKDDYLLTFVVPAVIILTMLLIASIVACVLYRRRLTGKMELGDEEERKSFRSKGIPVIFQDELDEKPEIGNKSPVILKDEKPPLLPPSYSSTNPDGDNEDVDDYVPPPAVQMGGRESRGKSPVTPSYRKPPPYVSP